MKKLPIHALVAGLLIVFTLSSGFILVSSLNSEHGKGPDGSNNKTAQPVTAKSDVRCGPSYDIYDNGDYGIDPVITSVTHIAPNGATNTYTTFPASAGSHGTDQVFIVNWASPTLGGAFRVFNPQNGRLYTCQNIPAGVTSATFNVATPTCARLTVAINGAWDACP